MSFWRLEFGEIDTDRLSRVYDNHADAVAHFNRLDDALNPTLTEVHFNACPFCGSDDLRATEWWDDDGEYDAIECTGCKAAAPSDVWNRRAGA